MGLARARCQDLKKSTEAVPPTLQTEINLVAPAHSWIDIEAGGSRTRRIETIERIRLVGFQPGGKSLGH
ncbi:MAG: hypothetical protein JWN34_5288 [Bryobacterales bacterium]|jgi:hypothetical protein|nr:hypothetical protein [Bryobacterales bacterium]